MKANYSYIYLAFFLLLNIFNFVDRNLLIAFAPQIKSEFNLTNVQWGLLTGVYFLFFYSVFGILMGVLGDKFSRMKIAAAGVFLWSLMTALTGVAKNFSHLIVARALIGNPSLIIADEPTSSIDSAAQQIFLDLMFEQIYKNESTLLMVSHDKSLSSRFDRLIDINEIITREN